MAPPVTRRRAHRARRTHALALSSDLGASPERVWERITTPEGVNYELRPFFRMTFPSEVPRLDSRSVPIGSRIGRCWLLLLGLLPVDYDDVTLVRVDDGRGFLERSSMLTQRVWEHERTVERTDRGCRLTDRVRFEPRALVAGRPYRAGALRLFRHRHRRLRRAFGGAR